MQTFISTAALSIVDRGGQVAVISTGLNLLTQNPFAVLTLIVAPTILTNATSVLAMSSINRMLRARQKQQKNSPENSAN